MASRGGRGAWRVGSETVLGVLGVMLCEPCSVSHALGEQGTAGRPHISNCIPHRVHVLPIEQSTITIQFSSELKLTNVSNENLNAIQTPSVGMAGRVVS